MVDDQQRWRAKDGTEWTGIGDGQWIEPNGDTFTPLDIDAGLWMGPENKLYKRGDDGKYYAADGSVWDGPTHAHWLNNRRSRTVLESSRDKTVFVKPRATTPTPRLARRCFRFKRRESPTKPREPVYFVPPPNIIVDRRRVGELIAEGQTQLMPLVKRLGIDEAEIGRFVADCKKQESVSQINEPPRSIGEPEVTPRRPPRTAVSRFPRFDPDPLVPPLLFPQQPLSPGRGRSARALASARTPRNGVRDLSNPFVISRVLRPRLLTQRARPQKLPVLIVDK
jgi:hypothetical protein